MSINYTINLVFCFFFTGLLLYFSFFKQKLVRALELFLSNHKYIAFTKTVFLIKKVFSKYTSSGLSFFRRSFFYLQVFSFMYMLFVYGCLYSVYAFACKNSLINSVLQNSNLIWALQAIYISTTGNISFCIFMMVFHGFLYRIELFRENYYNSNHKNMRTIIIWVFRVLRRSPITPLTLIGRTGGIGLGAINSPRGNGPQLFTWGVVVVSGVAIYNYRKYRTNLHNINAQTERQKYETDAKARQHDRAWDEYRKNQDAWEKKYPWNRGQPPTPPTI